jgi:hypothetical protein
VRSMSEAGFCKLLWTPVRGRVFELRAGSDVLAALKWEKMVGSLATGQTADGSWTLKRGGFLRPYVTVRVAQAEADLVVLRHGARGEGRLQFSNGRCFFWKPTHQRRGEMAFADSSGKWLIGFRPASKLFKFGVEVEIAPTALGLAELSVLTLVGFYRLALQHDEEAAAADAVAAAAN